MSPCVLISFNHNKNLCHHFVSYQPHLSTHPSQHVTKSPHATHNPPQGPKYCNSSSHHNSPNYHESHITTIHQITTSHTSPQDNEWPQFTWSPQFTKSHSHRPTYLHTAVLFLPHRLPSLIPPSSIALLSQQMELLYFYGYQQIMDEICEAIHHQHVRKSIFILVIWYCQNALCIVTVTVDILWNIVILSLIYIVFINTRIFNTRATN